MDNKEQLLKDYVATAQARNYDWEVVNSKFPEIDDLIKSMGLPSSVAKPKIEQLLKDYVATAEKREYDWALVNSKFPEFFPELKKKKKRFTNGSSANYRYWSATIAGKTFGFFYRRRT